MCAGIVGFRAAQKKYSIFSLLIKNNQSNMPLYELSLVLRPMPKKEIVDCLKRCAKLVWNENGAIKKIEYLGHNKLPFAIPTQNEGEKYHEGIYFLYHISLGNIKVKKLKPELKLDLDVLNSSPNLTNESKLPKDYQCTLEEELQPPALRKSVRPLLDDKNVLMDVRR